MKDIIEQFEDLLFEIDIASDRLRSVRHSLSIYPTHQPIIDSEAYYRAERTKKLQDLVYFVEENSRVLTEALDDKSK